jgi:D-hexose-6-phosphate mutarotase
MYETKDGFVYLSNDVAECKISLWGGNVVSYRPKSEENDVFWMGELNKFDNVQAIRGGIPVCWPRFAEEKLNNNLPRHGFARLSLWKLDNVVSDNEKIEAVLSLQPDEKYGVDLTAKLFVKVSDKLECCLETTNNGDKDFRFSEALHAYFNVGNRDDVIIRGLGGCQYYNYLDSTVCRLDGDLQIKEEFDGAFINHSGSIEIVDPVLNRVIKLDKTGSKSTVVWNPNKDLAEMSEWQYKRFVCVEPANQRDMFVTIAPKERHRMSLIVSVGK